MGLPVRKSEEGEEGEKEFTYGDYLTWPDEERWELIDGAAYDMSPAPSRRHQEVVGELYRQISNYLLDKPCQVYIAPFDIRLPDVDEKAALRITDEEIETVVQPDIVVVCEKDKLDERGCKGSPDIVIEVLSPWTAKKDMITKYHLYERHGVKQYWIFDPAIDEVVIFKLKGDKYGEPQEYGKGEKVRVDMFEGLEIDLGTIFG